MNKIEFMKMILIRLMICYLVSLKHFQLELSKTTIYLYKTS